MSAPGDTAQVSQEQPWPGLLPFTEEAQAFFHGRDEEARELARLIKRETLTVLFAQSGLGKSSLLRAGLFPRLRADGYLPVYVRLQLRGDASGLVDQLQAAVREECRRHGIDAPAEVAGRSLWEHFHRRDADFWSSRNQLLTPVLVFDQFEELFTLGHDLDTVDRRCSQFLDEIADLVEHRIPVSVAASVSETDSALPAELDVSRDTFRVVLSFREDYLADFEGLRARMPSIMRNRLRLARMTGEQAKAAILRSGSHLVTEQVADSIIEFVSASRHGARRSAPASEQHDVEPALLSVVCRELNNRRLSLGRAAIDAELLQGSAQQEIIRDFYDGTFQAIDPRLREFVEDQLLTEAGFRDSYAYDDALRQPGVQRAEIDRLVERRLLRLEERAGVLRIELTHDLLTSVAQDSRDRRQRELAERQVREREDQRRRRVRRLFALGAVASVAAVALIVTFAVLLQRSNTERQRLAETQSEVLLARANGLFEAGVAGEPQVHLARAIELNPSHLSAVARAMTYLSQRDFPARLAVTELALAADERPLDIDWREPGRLVLQTSAGERRLQVPVAAASTGATPAEAPVRLPAADAHRAWLSSLAPIAGGGAQLAWIEGGNRIRSGLASAATSSPGLAVDRPLAPIVVSANGHRAMLRSATGSVVVVSLAPGQPPVLLHTLPAAQGSARFGPEGRRIVARDGRVVTSYDLDEDRVLRLEHPLPVNAVEVSRDGTTIATACQDQYARLWDTTSGAAVAAPLRHEGAVLSVAFSADGQRLLSSSLDGTARLWSARTGQALLEPLLAGTEVQWARFAPDGRHALTFSADGKLGFWRLEDALPGTSVTTLPGPLRGAEVAGNLLAAAMEGGALGIWRTERAPTGRVPGLQRVWLQTTAGATGTLAFSPDGKWLAAATSDATVRLHDTRTGEPVGPPLQHRGTVRVLRFSRDGRLLLTGADDGAARLYDVASGKLRGFPMSHGQEAVARVAISDDHRHLLTVSLRKDAATLWLWPLDTREGVRVLTADHVAHASFVSGHAFVTVHDKSVQRWRLGSSAAAQAPPQAQRDGAALNLGHLLWSAAVSPEGGRLAVGGLNGTTRVVDLATLKTVGEPMKGVGVVESVAFSGDGRWLLTRMAGQVARLWDSRSGSSVADPLVSATPLLGAVLVDDDSATLAVERGGQVTLKQAGLDFVMPAADWLPTLVTLAGGIRQDTSGAMQRSNDRAEQIDTLSREADHAALPWRQRLRDYAVRLGPAKPASAPGAPR